MGPTGSHGQQIHHAHVFYSAHTTGHIKSRILLSLEKSEALATLASHPCRVRVGWDRGAAVPFPVAPVLTECPASVQSREVPAQVLSGIL